MQLLDLDPVRPAVRDALTVFPVWGGATVTRRGYDLSLTDLTVERRTGHAVMTELVVTNKGRRAALVLEGELLEGGRQVGVAARSMLIQPGETQVLEVRCVQQGRWAGSRANVRTGRRSFPRLRSRRLATGRAASLTGPLPQ
jgi:hypothetical protein